MPKKKRRDQPGDWFHIMNRAVARRTMFERPDDIVCFLDYIGEAVQHGWLEVHAYTVLTTHFHALVRSPEGELSRALRHIQLGYVRYFNRTRRRDGPLVRGRFQSKLVDSEAYRRVLVGYIDANAPAARLAENAADYPFGSCRDYVTESGPEWLSREWIHAEVCAVAGIREFEGRYYPQAFRAGFTDAHRSMIERRIATSTTDSDPVDSLLRGAAPAVLRWFRRKAELADGTSPGQSFVPAAIIAASVRSAPEPDAATLPRELRRTPWRAAALAVLLRDLAGLTLGEIGDCTNRTKEPARLLVLRARAACRENLAFATLVAGLGHAALVDTYDPASRYGSVVSATATG